MNVLKKIAIAIICTLLVFVVEGLSIVVCTKDIFENQLLTVAFKEGILDGTTPEQKEEVNKMLEAIESNKDVGNIINSVIEDCINGEVSDSTIDQVMKYVKDNKDVFNINVDDIDTPETRQEIRDKMNIVYEEVNKEDDQTVRNVLKTYSKISSAATIRNAIFVILVLIGLLVLLHWSYYTWMKPLSKVFITSSILMFLFSILIIGLNEMVKEAGVHMSVNNKLVLIFAFSELAIGILFKVLFKTFTKNDAYKPKLDQEQIIPPTEVEENSNTYE